MRPRWLWTWAFLAASVAAAALSAGPDTASGIHRFPASEAATVTHPPAWPGALQAVLRSDGHQLVVEGAAAEKTAPTARLLLLLAWLLGGGAALLRLVPALHPAFIGGGPPALARQRRWIGLRAPPSSQLF